MDTNPETGSASGTALRNLICWIRIRIETMRIHNTAAEIKPLHSICHLFFVVTLSLICFSPPSRYESSLFLFLTNLLYVMAK